MLRTGVKSTNLIFLDIDGVCNNVACHSNKATHSDKWHIRTAPECLQVLEWLLQQTGAKIVMSSSLRGYDTPENIQRWNDCWHDLGVPSAEVIGITPDKTRISGEIYIATTRGHEIDDWLQAHEKPENFVILDDDKDMWRHQSRLVQTNYHKGLTMEDAQLAIRILKRPLPAEYFDRVPTS